ncbi:6-phospho-3-hexuloisomerase [Ligilactobacillus salitolerans]|uniref:6-phospho-3-hexuloisomerase n=1 Tax=Ligilactobacillus salitolerans TaxID=1808352 RepID=A0A401IV69_9LACO|nr:6-phospho-3-hexuloisomerase [Ligilactobacillus salitolerans]GBG95441.1 6-phospho-3-hexuloisomerase [Ligilactobacillus salitolerans]
MRSETLHEIVQELSLYSEQVDALQIQNVAHLCQKAQRIFVAGAGRSGFAARGFANRLMQLGKETYFVGETTTPAIQQGDLLLIGSGSGKTNSLLVDAKKAKEKGAALATLTIYPHAAIGKLADALIVIPGGTPKNESSDQDTATSIQPMGTLFEQLSWLTYDALVLELMKLLGETSATMFSRHANLE